MRTIKLFLISLLLCTNSFSFGTSGCDIFSVFLMHADGANLSTTFPESDCDGNDKKVITSSAGAYIDTSQSVFGGASAFFDGSDDFLSVADSNDWNFGTGDFTIDLRFRTAVTTQDLRVFELGEANSDGIHFQYSNGAGELQIRINGNTIARTWSFSTNTWYHATIMRTGSIVRIFIDGIQI